MKHAIDPNLYPITPAHFDLTKEFASSRLSDGQKKVALSVLEFCQLQASFAPFKTKDFIKWVTEKHPELLDGGKFRFRDLRYRRWLLEVDGVIHLSHELLAVCFQSLAVAGLLTELVVPHKKTVKPIVPEAVEPTEEEVE